MQTTTLMKICTAVDRNSKWNYELKLDSDLTSIRYEAKSFGKRKLQHCDLRSDSILCFLLQRDLGNDLFLFDLPLVI